MNQNINQSENTYQNINQTENINQSENMNQNINQSPMTEAVAEAARIKANMQK